LGPPGSSGVGTIGVYGRLSRFSAGIGWSLADGYGPVLDLNEPVESLWFPRGFLGPHFFGFAHSGGQSVIHRRVALSVGLTPPPGTVGVLSICYATKLCRWSVVDINVSADCFSN
jgi:hypothetical protein